MSDDNVLSPTILAEKRSEMKNRGGINWLIDLLLEEIPNYVSELQQAITTGDSETLVLAAHKFKGSCSNVGAISMMDFCKQLEKLGRTGDMEKAAIIMANDLAQKVECLINALEREKQQD